MRRFQNHTILILILAVLTSSCLSPAEKPQTPQIQKTITNPTPALEVEAQPSPSTRSAGESNPLPPEFVEMFFFSEDGVELGGRFFPAATLDQPVVVFMHWYQGDQGDWEEIAYWLQNRGVNGTRRGTPWLDPGWFPALPFSTSYNVLTFTFRTCEGGCSQPRPEEWLLDARAALEAARSLQGVDPDQIISIGASIGGDAAISSCAAVLEKNPKACLGALSLSPGSYLGESYPDLVDLLGNSSPPRPAWCLYDSADPDAAVCEQSSGPHFREEGWQGGNLHGMHLITGSLDPLPLARILEFLEMVTNQ